MTPKPIRLERKTTLTVHSKHGDVEFTINVDMLEADGHKLGVFLSEIGVATSVAMFFDPGGY